MTEKRHDHVFPHFLIKNWHEKPWSKNENKRVKYKKEQFMEAENYYPIELENDLAKVEHDISKIIKMILTQEEFEYSMEQWVKIILYIKIKVIRLKNVAHYISAPEKIFPRNHEFSFGIYTTNIKEEVLRETKYLVNKYLNFQNERSKNKIFSLISDLGIVIWSSDDNVFVATDKVIFKEIDIDGKFLFLLMPISPKKAILVTKNNYYSSSEHLYDLYGDNNVSLSCFDNLLINNIEKNITKDQNIKIPAQIYQVNEWDVNKIVCTMSKDAEQLIFSEKSVEEIMEHISYDDPLRKII